MQDSYIVLKLFIVFIYAVSNPCSVNNGNCSYICLLSAVTPSRFSCVCPGDYVPTENQTHCKRKIHTESMHNNYFSTTCMFFFFFTCSAPPRLLFSVYSSVIWRVNGDGQSLVSLYSVTYPRALDFDFQ